MAGGAYQYGFSTAEDQQLQSNIVNQGAEATQNTENAALLREQQQSGGASTAPTGAQDAINAQVAATGAQSTATNLANEKLAGYEQGSKLFSEGTQAEEQVASLANPNAYASSATDASKAADERNKQWIRPMPTPLLLSFGWCDYADLDAVTGGRGSVLQGGIFAHGAGKALSG